MNDENQLAPFALQQTFPDQATAEAPAPQPARRGRGRPAGSGKKDAKANGKAEPRQRRARRAATPAAAAPAPKSRQGRKPARERVIPMSLLPLFKDLSDEETNAVLQFTDSVATVFGKKSRAKIGVAVGRLLGVGLVAQFK